jgi:hypothetical protein
MTGDDRLRAELEALERTAPADLPPLPSAARGAASWWRLVAPVATVALGAVLVLVVAPRWLGPLAPSTSPSASGRHSAEASASAAPSSPDMAWHVISVDEPGAIFWHISQVEGRLILGGSLLGRPQAWWSDDEGATWQRSSQDGAEALIAGSMGQVAGTHERLLSFGTRLIGANDSEVLPEIWISDDFGEHWRATDPQGAPPAIVEIAWNGSRFLAFTDTSAGAVDYVSNSIGVWASPDGQAWEQVAGTEPFGLSVAIIDFAQANDMTALALAGPDGSSELWLSDDGASWERSEGRSGIAVRPEALGSTGDDLVVVETKEFPAGSLVRDLLRSTDGRSWTATELNLQLPPPIASSLVSSITPGASGALLTGYTVQVRGGAGLLSWYLPDGADEARLLDVGIVDAAAVGDGFVGVYTCGPLADCGIALVYGLPAGQTPPQPTVDAETPDPTPSETFDDDPAEITGVLRGDQEQGIGCVWLTDAQGNRWEILWPEGYHHEFVDGVPSLMRDGEVVATAGHTIAVRGMRSRDLGSVCMVGIVYEASEVLLQR